MSSPTETLAERLEQTTDDDLVRSAQHSIWMSSSCGDRESRYDAECDAHLAEAVRREKPWLYQQAWNAAYRSAGHTPSEMDRNMARPSYHRELELQRRNKEKVQ